MRPGLAASLGFVTPFLAGRRRVLEVGCGRGDLAAALSDAGHDVVAIDWRLDGPAAGPRYVEADFFAYDGGPFDAVVLVAVLHHLKPIEIATARLARLLAPGAILLVDDFDVAATDVATARWFYDRVEPPAGPEPLERWKAHHEHDGEKLHDGATMLAALPDVREVRRGPYLFRYKDNAEMRVAEERAIAAQGIVPVGLQIVAGGRRK